MQEAVAQDKDLLKIITTKGNSTTSCNQHNRTQSLTVVADAGGKQVSSFQALQKESVRGENITGKNQKKSKSD